MHGFIPPGHFVVADGGYKLLSHQMRPHNERELSRYPKQRARQLYFSKQLRSARRVVERVFGIMKKRFLILVYAKEDSVMRRTQDCYCCCYLHNLLLDFNYPLEDDFVRTSISTRKRSVV